MLKCTYTSSYSKLRWDSVRMHGWVCFAICVSICFYACVSDRIHFLTFICVYEGQTKIASVRESGNVLMLSCVSSDRAHLHQGIVFIKMTSRLLAVSWHFNTIRKSLQIREEQEDRHVRWTARYALCHKGNIYIFCS